MDLCPLQGWFSLNLKKIGFNTDLLSNKWEDIASMWEGKDCAAQKKKKLKENDHMIPKCICNQVLLLFEGYASVTVLSDF